MRYLTIFIIIIQITVVSGHGHIQVDSLHTFSVGQLVSDLSYVKNLLEKTHPSLYRYRPKDTIERYFDMARLQITHPMNEVEFWFVLQRLIAQIGSGHTELLLTQKFIKRYDSLRHNVLPFTVYMKKDRLFVRNYVGKPDTSFKPFDEIISIDGETPQQLLNQIRTLISGDGYSNSFKNYRFEWGQFNRIYELLHPNKTEFSVIFLSPTTKKSLTVKAAFVNIQGTPSQPYDQIKRSYNLVQNIHLPIDSQHVVQYPAELSNTAFLQLKTFTYSDYLLFHKQVFKDLNDKGIETLVINTDNNTGGYDYICIDLLKYLVGKKFFFSKSDEGIIDVDKFSTLLSRNDKLSLVDISKLSSNQYNIKYPANEVQSPYKDAFKGKVYLLVNEGTFSAAALFAVALKTQSDCVVLGQETGGGEAGCDGGRLVKVILPQTSLQLNLPLLWTYSTSNQQNFGHGLKPDILIPKSAWDTSYLFMKMLIQKNNRTNK